MRRFLCAALILAACACSRRSLLAIGPGATADASDTNLTSDTFTPSDTRNDPDTPVANDTRPDPDAPVAIDTRPAPDTPVAGDTPYLIDTRPTDTRLMDSRPADTRICPSQSAQPGNRSMTVTVGSQNRSYVLYVPSTYSGSQPVPLIFDFHALGGNGTSQSATSPYPDETRADGVVMAFPTGLPGPGIATTAWNLGPCCTDQGDDIAFTKAMLDQIQSTVCIDKKRIYAVGHITGGGMAYSLACAMSDVFAAVSASAWDLLKENVDSCKPSRGITVVSFRGTGDTLVPYVGGYSSFVTGMPVNFLGAYETFKRWASIDLCSGDASKEDSKGCSKYSSCRDGAEVVLCAKAGVSEVGDPGIAWPLLKQHTL
jgi:polyhydroxybutyrate depolymerase